jgi:hypothetical protein
MPNCTDVHVHLCSIKPIFCHAYPPLLFQDALFILSILENGLTVEPVPKLGWFWNRLEEKPVNSPLFHLYLRMPFQKLTPYARFRMASITK